MRKVLFVLSIITIILFSFSFVQATWWNTSWEYVMPLTVEQTGSSTLTNIPILVNGTEGFSTWNLITDGKLDSQCKCLRFIDNTNTTELDWEWESYGDYNFGCGSNHTIIWLEINSLPVTNTTVYMYYDSSCGGAGFGNDTTGTWDSNFTMVLHLGECSGTVTNDSTSIMDGGEFFGNPSWNTTDGKFGCSLTFDRSDDWVKVTPAPVQGGNIFTYEAWFYSECVGSCMDASGKNAGFYGTITGGAGNNGPHLQFRRHYTGVNPDEIDAYCSNCDAVEKWISSNVKPNAGKWYYVVARENATHFSIFVNGTKYNSDTITGNCDVGEYVQLSAYIGDPAAGIDGQLDELRISNVSRSDDYILRQWQQELSYFGEEEVCTPEPPTTTTTTIRCDCMELTERVEALESRMDLIESIVNSLKQTIQTTQDALNDFTLKISGYLSHLSRGLRKKMVCGYMIDTNITEYSDLGLTCELVEGGKKVRCKCFPPVEEG